MKLCFVLIFISCLAFIGSNAEPNDIKSFKWRQSSDGVWSADCNFSDNDMDAEKSKSDECEDKCKSKLGCTHYSWFNGWCNQKSGSISKNEAVKKSGAVCGILNSALKQAKTTTNTPTPLLITSG